MNEVWYSPAQEVPLTEASLEAVLARRNVGRALGVTNEPVIWHSVDAPRTLAWLHRQAALLRVDREHRWWRPSEGTCKVKRVFH